MMDAWKILNQTIEEDRHTKEQKALEERVCFIDGTPLMVDSSRSSDGDWHYEIYCPKCNYIYAED